MNEEDELLNELYNAKMAEEREVEFERLKRSFEPIAMMLGASVAALQFFGFSRIEAIGLAIEFLKADMTGSKKHGK